MAKTLNLGNRIAPPRFLAFLAMLIVGFPVALTLLKRWPLAAMSAFDLATASVSDFLHSPARNA